VSSPAKAGDDTAIDRSRREPKSRHGISSPELNSLWLNRDLTVVKTPQPEKMLQ
jgi:hypothetical protein